jgi:hypothetical protein
LDSDGSGQGSMVVISEHGDELSVSKNRVFIDQISNHHLPTQLFIVRIEPVTKLLVTVIYNSWHVRSV